MAAVRAAVSDVLNSELPNTGAPLLFLYSCPEGAVVRAKMLHASCKGAVLA